MPNDIIWSLGFYMDVIRWDYSGLGFSQKSPINTVVCQFYRSIDLFYPNKIHVSSIGKY